MRRWPTVLLVISLIGNLFLLGIIGGGIWRWTHVRGPGPHDGWRMRAAESLPEPQASAFRKSVEDALHASAATLQEGRAARAQAARLFVQPTFDAPRVLAALEKARADDAVIRAAIEHRMIAFAATLPQDQRQKLAEALKAGPFREGRPH